MKLLLFMLIAGCSVQAMDDNRNTEEDLISQFFPNEQPLYDLVDQELDWIDEIDFEKLLKEEEEEEEEEEETKKRTKKRAWDYQINQKKMSRETRILFVRQNVYRIGGLASPITAEMAEKLLKPSHRDGISEISCPLCHKRFFRSDNNKDKKPLRRALYEHLTTTQQHPFNEKKHHSIEFLKEFVLPIYDQLNKKWKKQKIDPEDV